jgi:hypothetical protein
MSRIWKVAVALAVALPLGAYVAGSLARADETPPPREPIILREESGSPTSDRTPRPSTEPTGPTGPGGEDRHVVTPRPEHRDDDRGDDGGSGPGRDPDDDDDDDDDDGGGDDDRDDDGDD